MLTVTDKLCQRLLSYTKKTQYGLLLLVLPPCIEMSTRKYVKPTVNAFEQKDQNVRGSGHGISSRKAAH